MAIQAFLPSCNPNITSDAKVGVHQLAGAAGGYGYPTITDASREVERLLKGNQPKELTDAALEHLWDLCERAKLVEMQKDVA